MLHLLPAILGSNICHPGFIELQLVVLECPSSPKFNEQRISVFLVNQRSASVFFIFLPADASVLQTRGGSFLACENFGRMFDYEVESSSRTLIQLFRPGSVYSGSAS